VLRKAFTSNPKETQQDYSPLYNPTTGLCETNTAGQTDGSEVAHV